MCLVLFRKCNYRFWGGDRIFCWCPKRRHFILFFHVIERYSETFQIAWLTKEFFTVATVHMKTDGDQVLLGSHRLLFSIISTSKSLYWLCLIKVWIDRSPKEKLDDELLMNVITISYKNSYKNMYVNSSTIYDFWIIQ